MKEIFYSIFLMHCVLTTYAQNLVPNPSFEE